MKFHQLTKETLIGSALLLGLAAAGPAAAQSTPTKSDNSGVNKGDQNPGATTADQQKTNAEDRDISAKIRKAVVGDKSLSTYAHNVKIVSQNGTVTLKGPVRSSDEVQSIMAKATEVAGAGKVVNQMTVEPK
jgi:hyperosmotically inducible protein